MVAAVVAAVAVGAPAGTADAAGGAGHVRASALGELDCNGFSPIQKSVKPTLVCADPRTSRTERFEDNGHYIGHDEPSLRFLSSRPGSGSDVTWIERLPGRAAGRCRPCAIPGSDVTHSFELTIAPWFSMNLCDPKSDADAALQAAVGRKRRRTAAFPGGGAAFMELQFYPPGFAPFADSHQLRQHPLVLGAHHRQPRVQRRPATCNTNCIEPVNFALHPDQRRARPGRPARSCPIWRRSRRTRRPC